MIIVNPFVKRFFSEKDFCCSPFIIYPENKMKRGSCPDFSQEFGLGEESKESWISAFNRVNKTTKNSSNTVSGAERTSKPDLESIFGGRSETYIDNTCNTVSCDKAIMSNGHNILSLTRESIMNMSLSDAHETLFQLRVEGNIMKKGFKRLRLWKLRFFILSGKILTYWEVFIVFAIYSRLIIIIRCVIKQKLQVNVKSL